MARIQLIRKDDKMEFKILKEIVDCIIRKAVMYDKKCLDGLHKELEIVGKPIKQDLEELMKDAAVIKYIELEKQVRYVNRHQWELSSYYHD